MRIPSALSPVTDGNFTALSQGTIDRLHYGQRGVASSIHWVTSNHKSVKNKIIAMVDMMKDIEQYSSTGKRVRGSTPAQKVRLLPASREIAEWGAVLPVEDGATSDGVGAARAARRELDISPLYHSLNSPDLKPIENLWAVLQPNSK